MMTSHTTAHSIAHFLRDFLGEVRGDPAYNGLQVESPRGIRRVGTAVTLTARVVQAARDIGADCLIVHHGILWGRNEQPVVGAHRLRLKLLLESDISLIAFHLPLDAHAEIGNSVLLHQDIGTRLRLRGPLTQPLPDLPWLWRRTLSEPAAVDLASSGFWRVKYATSDPRSAPGRQYSSVTVATGKGESGLVGGVGLESDLYVTGELSLQAFEAAADEGRSVVCLGHHVSETLGVHALGRLAATEFDIEHAPLTGQECPV